MEEGKLTKLFNAFKVSEEMFEAVERLSARHGKKQQEMVRDLIRLGIVLQEEMDTSVRERAKDLAHRMTGDMTKKRVG